MTRELGQNGFGEYTTVITFLSFFAIIADLGLTLVTSQMINGKNKEEESVILGNLFLSSLEQENIKIIVIYNNRYFVVFIMANIWLYEYLKP
jgi:hypothetical protein